MAFFKSGQFDIHFAEFGAGPPVVLVHGFASNLEVNWVQTGWVGALVDAGHRVIALDNRGHGKSEKSHDPADYGAPLMAKDVINLAHHLGLNDAALLGYSMGARISAFAALNEPARFRAIIFGGLGINMVRGTGDPAPIIKALEAPALADVTHAGGRMFRAFAEHTGSDLKALAACMAASRQPISEKALGAIDIPALVAVGSHDTIGGDPVALAALLPRGEAAIISGRDHMRATGDKQFKQVTLDFLAKNLPT
ncbi:MAG: alpha/beta hydrolase [Alphaproteobacteria bacterium]|nr:alpha/beta hydrolase [Alphaproteobacteria bacterium]